MARRHRGSNGSKQNPWTLQPHLRTRSPEAAKIVGAEVLWQALRLFGSSDADAQPRARPSDEKKLRRAIRGISELLRRRATRMIGGGPSSPSGTARSASKLLIGTAEQLDEIVRTSSGPARRLLVTFVAVIDRLRRKGFTYGQIADIVLRSDTEWQESPCPELVRRYTGTSVDGSRGRDRLVDRIEGLHRTQVRRSAIGS